MIPKKIHYCWFGGKELPEKAKKCIASWKKFCPDYEIIQWNEENFNLNYNAYTRYCFENRRWAYLSDFVRLVVVYQQGGIYFDADVEVMSPLDSVLGYDAFFAFENESNIATGLGFGAAAGHPAVEAMIQQYEKIQPQPDGSYTFIGCPKLNTDALLPYGLRLTGQRQTVCGAEILPMDYMNPYDDPTGRLTLTENTLSIHWYTKSALSKKAILRSKLTRPLHRIFGKDFFQRFRK